MKPRLFPRAIPSLFILVVLGAALGSPDLVKAGSFLFVAADGDGPACAQADPCSLPTALALAVTGDTLYLLGGMYVGSGGDTLDINKSLTIHGGWDGSLDDPPALNAEANLTVLRGGSGFRAVHITGSGVNVTLTGFTISFGNVAGYGGGVNATGDGSSSLTVDECIISHNTAAGSYGGGIYAYGLGSVTITNSTFQANTAGYGGGAIELAYVNSATISTSYLGTNTATYGSAIELSHSTATLSRDRLRANPNSSVQLSDSASSISITNSYLIGPAQYLLMDMGGTDVIVFDTIVGDGTGTALYIANGDTAVVGNTILTGWAESIAIDSGSALIRANLFYGNTANSHTGDHEVYGNPCFIYPAGYNYHIDWCSAGVGKGADAMVYTDYDGDPRPLGNGYDIGADERWRETFVPFLAQLP
jgi:hypothetical protein